MIHPNCIHQCTSNCRREGCNCLCGNFHDSMDEEDMIELFQQKMASDLIAIQNLLMKYCDPKPEYSGKFAGHLAIEIYNAIK